MRTHNPPLALLALSLAVASSVPIASAQTVSTRLSNFCFSFNGSIWEDQQGMVGKGGSVNSFLGLDQGNRDFVLGGIKAGTGLKLTGSYRVKAGLDAYFKAQGGRFDARYEGTVQFQYPERIAANEKFNVRIKVSAGRGSNLSTTTPTYATGLDLLAQVGVGIRGDADFLSIGPWGKNFGNAILNERKTLFSVDKMSTSPIADLVGILTPIGVEFSAPVVATNGTVETSTGTLKSSGYSPFITLETTLASIAAEFAGAAGPLFSALDGRGTWDIEGIMGNTTEWDILKAYANLSFGMGHAFTLSPHPYIDVWSTNAAGGLSPTRVLLNDNNEGILTLTMPASGSVTVQPTLGVDPSFRNKVTIGIGGGVGFVPFSVTNKGYLGYGPTKITFNGGWTSPSYDWSSSGDIASLYDHDFPISSKQSQKVNDLVINPFDAKNPPDAVFISTTNGRQEAVLNHAFENYVPGADDPKPYRLTVYPRQGWGFGDNSTPDVTVSFDGQSAATIKNLLGGEGLSGAVQAGPSDDRDNPNRLDAWIPARLLKPGRHSVQFTFTNVWNGVTKQVTYAVPVVVPTPVPSINGGLSSDDQFSGSTINTASMKADTVGYLKAKYSFLDTQVVLDDTIVLPSVKWLDGKEVPTGTGRDTEHVDDALQTQFYFSGNDTIKFTIPVELARKLSGTKHTIRLRTRDYATNDFVLSNDKGVGDMYFVVGAPKITGASFAGIDDNFPLSAKGYNLQIEGANFVEASSVSINGYDVPFVLKSDRRIQIPVSKELLDEIQNSTVQTLCLSVFNPRYEFVSSSAGGQSVISGGATNKQFRVRSLTPVVFNATPSALVRGEATTLILEGSNFVKSPEARKTQVTLGGKAIPSAWVEISGDGDRELTQISIKLPADFVTSSSPLQLRVKNEGTDSLTLVTVANPVPVAKQMAPSTIASDGATTYSLKVNGSGYIAGVSHVLIGGKEVAVKSLTATDIFVDLSPTLLSSLTGASQTVSVVNDGPGGGQSKELNLQIVEADPKTVSVALSGEAVNVDLLTQTQALTVTYTGTRVLNGTVLVKFSGLPTGITLVGSTTVDGVPALKVNANSVKPNGTIPFSAKFKRTTAGTDTIPFTLGIKLVM